MNNIKILSTGNYLPSKKIDNRYLSQKFKITEEYIEKMTGIKNRYYKESEDLLTMAYSAGLKSIEKAKIQKESIDLIIVATTSTRNMMPGISFLVQKKLNIKCMCFDILAGCGGFINAFDIAVNYIKLGKIKKALVIGCDILSEIVNTKDYSTSILFGDGAGAVLITKSDEEKKYYSIIESCGQKAELLTYKINENLQMDGIGIYKYAVTETVKIIKKLLVENNEKLENIKYIVPHQSNKKIMDSISEKLEISKEKVYKNIQDIGNTFCASIPIVIDELTNDGKIQNKDKIILLGYRRRPKYWSNINRNIRSKK